MTHQASVEGLTRDCFEALVAERAQLDAMDAEILETQVAIAAIPAPTGSEGARGAWVSARLSEMGYETRADEVGNVIATSRSHSHADTAPVVIASHLDTVFPAATPLAFSRRGDRVTGPGICDNGRGLAAMIALARVLAGSATARRLLRRIEFVATVGEEGHGDLRGARHYMATSPPCVMVALDGAGDERIVNVGLGSRRFRVEYRGPGGHSWNAYGTANPIHAAVRAASTLAGLRLPAGTATLTVSRIGGGLSVNSIPGDAWFEVDVRGTHEATLARLEHELRDVVSAARDDENARATRGPITLSVERIGARPAGETTEDSPIVQAAMAATRIVQRTPTLATASTDANAAMAAGVPAISIGGGGTGGDTHSTNEWYENTGASAGLQRALTLLVTLAQLPA